MSYWSVVIPMNIAEQVCREKVAFILSNAPFLISKLSFSAWEQSRIFLKKKSDFQQVGRGVTMGFG